MDQIDLKKHHFLFYIFQFDKKDYIMDAEKEISLHRKIHEMLGLTNKGDSDDGTRKAHQLGAKGTTG